MARAHLTAKQKRFVDEYLIDLNGTQAAIRAGYSARSARVIANEILTKPAIAEAIAVAQQLRAERTHITQDRVLQELARVAFFDIRKLYREDGTLKAPHELDDDTAGALAGIDVVEMTTPAGEEGAIEQFPIATKKTKAFDKMAAIGLAMRHLGILKEKVELTGKDGGPIVMASPLDQAL